MLVIEGNWVISGPSGELLMRMLVRGVSATARLTARMLRQRLKPMAKGIERLKI